ncbi:DUF2484 family protein [Maritimibacter fusiformis]|uniref:DUF2484 family protein n=1 Tax=Maritimibacter fusiformis TaxID=2603819 RepID=A0A5D0RJ17_9RHOB|nr:DUF2484 family protein [Maritimibacter fusiformis]TYB80921.1 DUF2484 family protein [Maritimibacter fusiformis]
MTASLIAACVWALTANLIAMFPSRRQHWPAAWGLIAVGIPIVGWVTWQSGPLIGLVVLAAGMSVLRWPVRYLVRWVRDLGRPGGA